MDFLIILLATFAVIALIKFLTGHQQPTTQELHLDGADSVLLITPQEVSQINLLASWRHGAPELAAQLGARLSGDAWQVAHMSLCSTLFQLGLEEESLQAFARLDKTQKQNALVLTLQELIDNGQSGKALALLQRLDADMSIPPLLKSNLLLAEGKIEEARLLIEQLAMETQLSDTQRIALAGLQQRCNLQDAAMSNLNRVRTILEDEDTSIEYWFSVLQVMADLHQYSTLMELAELSEEHKQHIARLLISVGQYEQAMTLLAQLPAPDADLLDHEEILDQLLASHQHALAQRLLELTTNNVHALLLQRYVNWHVARGETAKAQELLDVQGQRLSPITLHWLLLQLLEQHHDTQPTWASGLQSQAERLLHEHRADLDWPFMRLDSLHQQLLVQARRSASQRDSWSIRQLQEETERLHAELPFDEQITQQLRYCTVLKALGQDEPLRERLTHIHERLSNPEPGMEDAVRYLSNNLLSTLITLGELDQAQALHERLGTSSWHQEDLQQAYINADRLEDALEKIDLQTTVAINEESVLPRLHKRIDGLKEQDPSRHQRLMQRLFALFDEVKGKPQHAA